MVHPPFGQSWMMQVAPVAHWMLQGPFAQVLISQVAPAEQWSMKHAT